MTETNNRRSREQFATMEPSAQVQVSNRVAKQTRQTKMTWTMCLLCFMMFFFIASDLMCLVCISLFYQTHVFRCMNAGPLSCKSSLFIWFESVCQLFCFFRFRLLHTHVQCDCCGVCASPCACRVTLPLLGISSTITATLISCSPTAPEGDYNRQR